MIIINESTEYDADTDVQKKWHREKDRARRGQKKNTFHLKWAKRDKRIFLLLCYLTNKWNEMKKKT